MAYFALKVKSLYYKRMSQISIKHLLNPESQALSTLLGAVSQLQRWNEHLKHCLQTDEKLLEHCQIVRFNGSTLVILTDNPHWNTRFRFHSDRLLVELRQYPEFKHLTQIQTKVRPPQFEKPRSPRKPSKLSVESKELLQEILKIKS